jgi:hypothetical protein
MAQLRPRVRIDVREAITLQAQAGTGVVAILGTATWGEKNTVQTITSLSQGIDLFKDDKTGTTNTISLIKGLELLYRDGAGTVKAVRVGDGDEAKATKAFDGNAGGEVGVLTFSGLYEGTYGNNIGITITANAITATNRDITITDGLNTELFDNNGAGYATNAAIGTAINGVSTLVTVAVKAGSETSNIVDASTQTYLTGGDDGEDSLLASDYTTAFDNVLANEDFDILVIPGSDALEASDAFHASIVGKLNTRASSDDKFAIFVSGIAKDETITTAQARTASGERLTLVAPNIKYTHRIDGNQIILNGSYLACSYAGGMAGKLVQIAPTHKVLNVEGLSVLESTGKDYYNNGEQESLLSSRIVPITSIFGGIMAARGVTRITDTTSVFYEQNIVRIVDYVKAQVLTKLNGFIGDPNLERVRTIISKEVDGILEQDKLDEVIAAYQATEVACGASPDTVLVNMTIQPTFAINFINVSLTISQLQG